ncbi:MAG: hypothetical protein MSA44_00060, partial [Bacteroidales bacterium]|nr:hypothetical protein [Bacteroidales bacterium]
PTQTVSTQKSVFPKTGKTPLSPSFFSKKNAPCPQKSPKNTYIFSAFEVSRPYHTKSFGKFDTTTFQEIILSSGVFRRETASGFYPWGNVVSPRKRVAEGLCGWRHGNSFPMTQSAQSLRQMRSIPHCSKAVFYVFVFESIHNSATLHNLSPGIFH